MFFDSRNSKKYIEIALKPTAIKLQATPIKTYNALYVCEKKCGIIAE